jgi:hypothetical protein
MPWYSSVKQIRQAKGTSKWAPVVQEAAANVEAFLKTAESAAE